MDKNFCNNIFVAYQYVHYKTNRKNTLQHQALSKEKLLNMLELIKNGHVDVNAKYSYGQTALHLITSQVHIGAESANPLVDNVVRLLIHEGAFTDAQDYFGNTALHLAAVSAATHSLALQFSHVQQYNKLADPEDIRGFDQYVTTLETLCKLIDLNITNSLGKTALHIAAEGGCLRAVETLLAAGANVHITDAEGNTPLHSTFKSKQNLKHSIVIFEKLLDKGAVVNVKNILGETPMHFFIDCCVHDSQCDRVRLNRAKSVDVNLKALQLFIDCCVCDSKCMMERYLMLLLSRGVDLGLQDKKGETCLIRAVQKKLNPIGVDCLLRCNSFVNLTNNEGNSALHYAALSFSLETMRTLLRASADSNMQNEYGKTALHIAVEHGFFTAVSTLLSAGADVNIQDGEGNTPLHRAIILKQPFSDCLLILRALMDKDADVNVQNIKGETALHLFIDRCAPLPETIWVKDFRNLLSHGANVNLQDDRGLTCLMRAVQKKLHLLVIHFILSHNAFINLVDKNGNSALHHAMFLYCQQMIAALIKAGADSNLKNKDGKTPLHVLFERYYLRDVEDLIELSVSHGFNINIKDREGDTLLHLAARCFHQDELLRALLVNGARNGENCNGETMASLYVEHHLYRKTCNADLFKLTEAGVIYYMANRTDEFVEDYDSADFYLVSRSGSKELDQMKQTKIGSIFTRYKDPVYATDAALEELVASSDLLNQFPIYGLLLCITFERAKRRNRLLDFLMCNFNFSANIVFPLEIKRLILSQLSDQDLSHVFKAIGFNLIG